MEKKKITAKIVGREYPMMIDPDDEEIIRKAAAMVSERVAEFVALHKQNDLQDALSVVAFNCLVREMRVEYDRAKTEAEANLRLQRINSLISQAL